MSIVRERWNAFTNRPVMVRLHGGSGSFFLLMIGRVVEGLANLVQLRLLTEFLAPKELGRYNLFLSLYMLFSLAFVAPIGSFLMRQLTEWSSRQFWRESGLFTIYLVAAAILSACCYLIWASATHIPLFMSPPWLFGLLILFACVSFQQVNATYINIIGFSHYYVPLSALGIISGTAVAVFAGVIKADAEHWGLGFGGGYAIALVVTFYVLQRLHRRVAVPEGIGPGKGVWAREAWAHAGFVLVATICSWLQTAGYRFLLERDLGLSALGIFVAAYGVGMLPLSLVMKICNDYLQPELFGRYSTSKRGHESRLGHLIPAYVNVVLVSMMIFGVLVPVTGRVLTSSTYWPYLWLAFWGILNQGVFALYTICSNIAQANLKSERLVPATVISSLALVIAISPATRNWGLNGIGLSIFFALLVNLILTVFSVQRLVIVPIRWLELWKGLTLAAVSGLVLGLLSVMLGQPSLMAGAALLVCGGLIWLGSVAYCLR